MFICSVIDDVQTVRSALAGAVSYSPEYASRHRRRSAAGTCLPEPGDSLLGLSQVADCRPAAAAAWGYCLCNVT